MTRFARVVSPSHPHHVVHRGNRRQTIFLEPHDRSDYLRLLGRYAARFGVRIWAYCLMPNHVHLIAVPAAPNSLAKGIGNAHWRFAQALNRRLRRTGHVWQNRYYSSPLDPHHLWAAVRYVERNPLRAGLVRAAEEYPWSSARAHALGEFHELLDADRPFVGASFDWSAWLNDTADGLEADLLRANTRTGRPTGAESFVELLEAKLDRCLRPRRRGRKPAPADPPAGPAVGEFAAESGAAAAGRDGPDTGLDASESPACP